MYHCEHLIKIYTFIFIIGLSMPLSSRLLANPFHDPTQIHLDTPQLDLLTNSFSSTPLDRNLLTAQALPVLRIDIAWDEASDSFNYVQGKIERSGTEYLEAKSQVYPHHGSFIGVLQDSSGQKRYSSIGTGQEFRRLSRGLAFRFPAPSSASVFKLIAEDPISGNMVERLMVNIDPSQAESIRPLDDIDTRLIKSATASPVIRLVVYAEGYTEQGRERFFNKSKKVAASFADSNLPTEANLEIIAAFTPSKLALGTPRNLGTPVPERESFLGLYYPYWNNFGRWYHVVYPTRFQKYRDALAQVPYDYPLALIDSNQYWGVGNYMELTAIPAESTSFRYLLLHEFGHFLGLNEEYEGGGRTELEFAPGITEPWSQNITFNPGAGELKWANHLAPETPLPTPREHWNPSQSGPLGAYRGGYADSASGKSFKPGFSCIMETSQNFCLICQRGILDEFISWQKGRPEFSFGQNH